jgi:hypothetical protein
MVTDLISNVDKDLFEAAVQESLRQQQDRLYQQLYRTFSYRTPVRHNSCPRCDAEPRYIDKIVEGSYAYCSKCGFSFGSGGGGQSPEKSGGGAGGGDGGFPTMNWRRILTVGAEQQKIAEPPEPPVTRQTAREICEDFCKSLDEDRKNITLTTAPYWPSPVKKREPEPVSETSLAMGRALSRHRVQPDPQTPNQVFWRKP